MAVVDEVPEEEIEAAERTGASSGHDHEGVTGEDGTLRQHLEDVHRLEVPPGMSASTQDGLHDRLHDDTAAADD
ncbi:MAG TPA: hypothetical protein VK988_10775 [Acidimicrobiales bacterium]|nr:hypothetical protein [Acidimicrobiales bacterium]